MWVINGTLVNPFVVGSTTSDMDTVSQEQWEQCEKALYMCTGQPKIIQQSHNAIYASHVLIGGLL